MKHIVDSFRVVLLVFVVVLTFSFVASQSAQAQTLTTLHTFDGTDGAQPFGSLVQAANGELYGITQDGGSRVNCGAAGCGTIFRIAPKSGTLTTLLNFCNPGRFWETGKNPAAGLVEATDLYLYGVTGYGGYNENGTVFKIKPGGKLTVLHHFDGTDGNQPSGPLVQAANGDFYGMTASGGANGDGTVFEITPSGTLTTLYSFCAQTNCTDGRTPFDGLVQATNGDFYGTTVAGGATSIMVRSSKSPQPAC